ncbi:dihydroxyacetone kinase family protein [Neomicrococcus lactis]
MLIVKNYTGDRLNFGLAAEIARGEGLIVDMVVVGDDVALSLNHQHAGRRGLAGTILVHKIAGGAADRGDSLEAVMKVAERVIDGLSTMSVGLGGCVVPGEEEASSDLSADEVEWGLGIHGESGVERSKHVTAQKAAERLVSRTLEGVLSEASALTTSEQPQVVLMLNNLGGTSNIEMGVMAREVLNEIRNRDVKIQRFWSGAFMTALEMPGVSVTCLHLGAAGEASAQELLDLLDAPVTTLAWPAPWVGRLPDEHVQDPADISIEESPKLSTSPAESVTGKCENMGEDELALLRAVTRTLKNSESELTRMDRIVGDGDLGLSLTHASNTVDALLDDLPRDPSQALTDIASAVRKAVGGTSGPLYAIGLLRAAHQLGDLSSTGLQIDPEESPSAEDLRPEAKLWAVAFDAGVRAIEELGGAIVGDCTMIDALRPAANTLLEVSASGASVGEALSQASLAAQRGAESTRELRARKGRASYVGDRAVGEVDPGAWAVYLWLTALAEASRE